VGEANIPLHCIVRCVNMYLNTPVDPKPNVLKILPIILFKNYSYYSFFILESSLLFHNNAH